MIAGSLFSGIEGFGLGLLWSGLISRLAWQVEIDPFCRRVLDVHFPNVDRSVTDVQTASASTLAPVDFIFGGFPCQDVSAAGKGAGLSGERSGLWSEFRRIVGEFKPKAVLVENVASGAKRYVCAVRNDLRSLGYRTRALNIGVDDCGGPHRRKRIFILAYTDREQLRLESGRGSVARGADSSEPQECGEAMADAPSGVRFGEAPGQAGHAAQRNEGVAHADSNRRIERPGASKKRGGLAKLENRNRGYAQPELGGEPHGVPARVARWPAGPSEEQHAWEPPRTSKDAKERAAKLKAIGNAVSPIQAYHVGLWARSVLQGAA